MILITYFLNSYSGKLYPKPGSIVFNTSAAALLLNNNIYVSLFFTVDNIFFLKKLLLFQRLNVTDSNNTPTQNVFTT